MEGLLQFIFIFIFGAIAGSFLNVVLLRKNTGESVARGRSRCFSCGYQLAWYDNIPILSFLALRGRCRRCGSKISWQYPLVEFVVGLLAILVFVKTTSYFLNSIFYFLAFAALFLVAAYDLRTKFIDSGFLYFFAAFATANALLRWLENGFALGGLWPDILAAFLIALFFYALWKFSGGRWMGRGDADVAFWVSLFLGHPLSAAAFILSFWIGGLAGILLLALKSARFSLKSEIPFAPFLALAMFLAWYFSEYFMWITGLVF